MNRSVSVAAVTTLLFVVLYGENADFSAFLSAASHHSVTTAPPRNFPRLSVWVWAVWLSAGEGSPPTSLGVDGVCDCAPRLLPKHCGPFTAVQVARGPIIYRSHTLRSPRPTSLSSPMMRRTHTIMAMLARLDRVHH